MHNVHNNLLSIAASVGKDNLKLLNRSVCSKMDHDPPNRFANENIYAWYIVVSYFQQSSEALPLA